MNLAKALLARLKNDGHVPVALLVFAVTTIYHFVSHRDLGANYVGSLYAMYSFLAGHAIAQRFGGGSDGQQ